MRFRRRRRRCKSEDVLSVREDRIDNDWGEENDKNRNAIIDERNEYQRGGCAVKKKRYVYSVKGE